ncbi:MAG: tRNA(Ile)(2)-agmatinylcytidine synthase [Candidatus Bathyarchaeota archaeon]|nr:tRNA(Ile)(2)-agmatinylcytidine synthase [Candidatus Bathyarchaeota archaeon]
MVKLHIGIDDTDSPRMGCTTYVAALIVQRLRELSVPFIDYPNLIRLNPNVPWKTRGNGALCLRVRSPENLVDQIKEIVIETVEENADLSFRGTDPGIVFLPQEVPPEIQVFARNAIQGLVTMDTALCLIRRFGAEAVGLKKGRGIVGGLAAIGEKLTADYTYEIIAYRRRENRGTVRRIDAKTVVQMDMETRPLTFNNVDTGTGRILITPRGPDPILYGIRGETPEILKKAFEIVRCKEPIERWVIFRTNHGTDAHLRMVNSIKEVNPHNPVIVKGTVAKEPRTIPGGHVIFSIHDRTGQVDCAAYEPTGELRKVVRLLKLGDLIEAMGGARSSSANNPTTLNLEKIRILRLTPNMVFRNPECPKCRKRMESMGRSKGFRCKKCRLRDSNLKKTVLEIERPIEQGLHIVPPRSQRHLTKPLSRYGLEKKGKNNFGQCEIPYDLFLSQ